MIAVPLSKVLSVVDLRRNFRETVAVDSVSFEVGQGEIVGLLGPNGAGKTTIINMILGLLEPTAGTIRIEGEDIARHRSRALERTNFAASYTPLPGNLTVRQNLQVFGLLYHVANLSDRIEEVIDLFRLRRFRDVKCGLLSSGEQARVSLAKAMLNRPRLLLLDEPTVSLDPATAADARNMIRAFASEKSCGCSGRHTTCTRWRRYVTAFSSCKRGRSSSRVTRRFCRASMAGKPSKSCSSPWRGSR